MSAAVYTVLARRLEQAPDRHCGVKRIAIAGETERQVTALDAPETLLDLVRPFPAFGEVQEQEYVGDQLLSARVKCRPAGRRRDPQMVLPVLGCLRCARTHAGDDAALVYPQESFGDGRS